MSYSWQFELECAGRDARNRVIGLLAEDSRKNAAGVREWSMLLRKTMQTIEIQLDRAELEMSKVGEPVEEGGAK